MRKVFVSYASEDFGVAQEVEREVRRRGLDVWLDRHALHAGEEWIKSIDGNISSSDAVIVILTPRSRVSPYVDFEWSYALGKGIKVIPLLLEPTEKYPRLDPLQHLDFTNPRA